MQDEKPQREPGRSPWDQQSRDLHRNKVETFKLQIGDDDLIDSSGEELYSTGTLPPPPKEERPVLNSYSSPKAKQNMTKAQKHAQKQDEKAHRRRNREKRFRNRILFKVVWLAMVVLVGLSLGQYLVGGINDMLAAKRSDVTVTVEIPKESTTDQIADALEENGVIDNTTFFKMYSKLTKADGNFNHGTFEISTGLDYEAIISTLQSNANRVDTVKITFPEGLNVREIAQLLEKNGVCKAEDVLKYANSQDFDKYDIVKMVSNDSERYYLLEGYLFPDTYDFYKDEDPEQALGKMINNSRKKLTAEIRDKAAEMNMTVDEMLNLAALIQAESADEDDMYKVSSVLHNRLENGVETGTAQLGCDSTVFYPYRVKSQLPVSEQESYHSRYDTYTLTGLPPGPICNPGMDAIKAALDPDKTNYYYFCHSKEGKAYYAKTADQHQKNLKKAGLID